MLPVKGRRSCLPERRKTLGPGTGLTAVPGDRHKCPHRSPAPARAALREDPATGRGGRWSLSWGGQRRSRGAAGCVCGSGRWRALLWRLCLRPGFLCLGRAQLELSPRVLMENDGAASCTVCKHSGGARHLLSPQQKKKYQKSPTAQQTSN